MESIHLSNHKFIPSTLESRAELVCHNDPFNPNDTTTLIVPIGSMCSEVLKDFNFDTEFYDLVISKNQEILDTDFVVEEYDIVSFILVPKGGGSSKQILMVVAMVALMVAAPYLAGMAMSATAGMVGAGVYGGSMGFAIFTSLQVGITIAGSMLISSLFKPSAPPVPSLQSFEQSSTYGWNVAGNQIQQGGNVPILYGTTKITPQYIGKYLETVNDKQYLKVLLALGEGPFDSIGTIEINDAELDTFQDVIISTRYGTNTQSIIPAFNDTWSDQAVNKKLTNTTTWVSAETQGDSVSSITVGVVCPSGVYYANDAGGMDNYSVKIDIEYKEVNSTVWKNLATEGARNARYYYVDQNPSTTTATTIYGTVYNTPTADTTGPFDVYKAEYTSGYLGSLYLTPVYVETITSLPVGVVDKTLLVTPVRQMVWTQTSTTEGPTYYEILDKKSAAIRRSYKLTGLTPRRYEVRMRFYEEPNTSSRYGSTTYFEFLQEAISDDFTYPNTALLGMNILATDQISGGMPKITCMASRITGTYGRLDNPAWACLDILMNGRYGAGVPIERIDLQSFQNWADYCTTEGFTVNVYLDQNLTLVQTLQLIGQLGRGTIMQYGSSFTALIDKPNILPTQGFLFSMGNIIQDSFSETFLPLKDRANIIEVTYYDRDNGYDRASIEVSQGNYDLTSQVNKTQINLIGCVTKEQAIRQAKYHLNQNRYLTITAEWEASIDAIACKVGDIVNVSHDVPQWGYSGRIISNTTNTITVDRDDLALQIGKSFYIQISNSLTDEQVYVPVTSILGNVLTTSSTLGTLGEYSVYSFGEVNRHAKQMRILAISTAGELKRKISAIEYNPNVYNDLVPVPTPIQVQDLGTKDLEVSEYLVSSASGVLSTIVQLSWKGAQLSYKVYYKRIVDTSFKLAGTARGSTFEIPNLKEGTAYTFKVESATLTYTVLGKTLPPPIVSNLQGSEVGNVFSLSWNYPYTPLDFKEFIIKDGATQLGSSTTTTFTSGVVIGSIGKTLTVYAKDTTGNLSAGISIYIPISPIVAISNLDGTEDGNVFTITWDYPEKPTDFKQYDIYHNGVLIGSSTIENYTSKVLLGTDHTFKIKVKDTSGNLSPFSLDLIVPIAEVVDVTDLAYTESGNIFTLTWVCTIKPTDFRRYVIYKNSIKIGTSIVETFTTQMYPGITSATFMVKVEDTANNFSSGTSKICYVNPLDSVTGLSYTESGNQFTLNWAYSKPSDFKQFVIYDGVAKLGVTTANTYTTKVLSTNNRVFTVQTEDTAGNLTDATVSAIIVVVAPVTGLAGTESGNIFTATWSYTKPNDFKQFVIYNGAIKLGTTAAETFTTARILGIAYLRVTVYAEDTAGNLSAGVTYDINVVPVAPVTGLVGTESGNIFTLNWAYNKPIDFKQFIIYNGIDKLGTTAAETYVTKRIPNVTSLTFTVYVEDTAGSLSVATDVIVAVTPVPTIDEITLVGSVSLGVLNLAWGCTNKPTDFLYYEVYDSNVYIGNSTTETYSSITKIHTPGLVAFSIVVVDTAGNKSTSTVVNLTITALSLSTPTYSFNNELCTLTWDSAKGSYAVDKYVVTIGAETFTTVNNSVTFPCSWLGGRLATVVGYDTAGNTSTTSTTITVTAPSAPVVASQINATSGVRFSWTCVPGTCGIQNYLVTYGGNQITTSETQYFIPTTSQGSYIISVVANDYIGNSSTSGNTTATINNPVVSLISGSTTANTLVLQWAATPGSFNIKEYVVEYTDGLSVAKSITVPTKSISIITNWLGIKTFSITPKDIAGNSGVTQQYNYTIIAPDTPSVVSTIVGNSVVFAMSITKRSYDISQVVVTYDTTSVTIASTSPTWSIPVFWDLSKNFTFKAVDVLGNESSLNVKTITITEGTVVTAVAEVIDNNVLLRWSATDGTLPIESYRVSKGNVYATSIAIGSVKGTFNTIFESQAGSYTYWITPIDSAGNEGVYKGVPTTVSQPPDFVLNVNWVSDWSGTKTNVKVGTSTAVLPVNTTINYQTHFTTYSWATPNAQVVAGYPLWLTPSTSTASYTQQFDYGVILGSTSITLTDPPIIQSGTGTYTMTRQISTSLDNVTWTAHTIDALQVYVTNIRYVKVVYSWTVSTTALLNIGNFSLRLDAKIKSDSGTADCTIGGAQAQGNVGSEYYTWYAGMSMPPVGFGLNGTTNENRIIRATGPSGALENLWACVDVDVTSDADGGWNSSYNTADTTKGHLFAVFMKTTTNNGSSYFGTNTDSKIASLSGTANSNPYFWLGDLPTLDTWYLVVGYVHAVGYGTTDTGIAGIYDLSGGKVVAGTEFKALAGCTTLMHRVYYYYNTTNSGAEVQYTARPIILPCTEADAPSKISYLIQCITAYGATVDFNSPFVDITSINVSLNGTTPTIPIYDFVDVPNPKRFNIFNYSTSGASSPGTISWAVRGY